MNRLTYIKKYAAALAVVSALGCGVVHGAAPNGSTSVVTANHSVQNSNNTSATASQSDLTVDHKNQTSLVFDDTTYETKSMSVNGETVQFRAYTKIPYVSNPTLAEQQYMNIYIPEAYFSNGTINGYTATTAPIFMPNGVVGYMPGRTVDPSTSASGSANSALYALSRGYVVATPATRGRTNQDDAGQYVGKAPAVIVDLQAAVAYLHANDNNMPGDANRIITNGTSAGGAVSLLQGATGNSSDFTSYLQEQGAANARTDVFAVSAYCPITNLDHADGAYEWSYYGIKEYDKTALGQGALPEPNMGALPEPTIGALPEPTIGDEGAGDKTDSKADEKKPAVEHVVLTNDDIQYSGLLKQTFPSYVNSLQLRDAQGRLLTLDKNGNGSFKEYVKSYILQAVRHAKAKGADLSKHTYIVTNDKGVITDIDWDAYNAFVGRSKGVGAFDARSNDTGENNLFGTTTVNNHHFTKIAKDHDTSGETDVTIADANIVRLMNPMNYLGNPSATNATHYRIRYGTADSNTSVAIPLIVGTRAQNLGYDVDMATPFNIDHSGDYDLVELFDWMDGIVKASAK